MKLFIIITMIIFTVSLTVSSIFGHRWCWTCDQDNTVGWQIMTPEERKDHQDRLTNFSSYSSCRDYIDTHNQIMEERAKKSGISQPAMRENPCDTIRAKGAFRVLPAALD